MNTSALKPYLGIIVAVGSVWGLTEFAACYTGKISPTHSTHPASLLARIKQLTPLY